MQKQDILKQLDQLNEQQLRRLLAEHLTSRKLGLVWEADLIARDKAVNVNIVLPKLIAESSCLPENSQHASQNLIIEGDNYDALRLLRTTHRGKIRVIYIDPPYNTGNKDWVYNDRFVSSTDKYRHSQWLEFLYRRLVLARDLLTPDGVIMVSINDENRSKLELLMDEVFPNRRLGSLVWRTKDTGNDLSQRFSHVHEHILVYANSGFKFNGKATNKNKFRNPDNDPRGDWSPQPLSSNKTFLERPNTYYPIQNPETGYWYPCDPDSVWRFASEKNICQRLDNNEEKIQAELMALRSDTIEALISKKLIYFPPCSPEEVMIFETKEALLQAIRDGNAPILPKKKTPLLRENLPDIDFWVGKLIATGRPSRKELWTAKPEEERLAPLGSWVGGFNEDLNEGDDDLYQPTHLRSDKGGVANDEIKSLLGHKAFSYPKPFSLIYGLIQQASKPNDIILDFFAGSGTTAHAVLALNNEDGGNRQFILCSSTEATAKEPDKNLCRDVCAERVRSVINGKNTQKALGGSFAYLQLDLLQSADALFELTPEHATLMLRLREAQAAGVETNEEVIVIASNDTLAVLVCPVVSKPAIKQLLAYPCERVAVYSDRPDTVEAAFIKAGRVANSYNLADSLIRTQKQVSGK
jgi:adenine-specific DNA-methyltransferase